MRTQGGKVDIKSYGELMDDLGFNKDASFETKKAFLKHLFQEATISELNRSSTISKKESPVQMSLFDYNEDKSA